MNIEELLTLLLIGAIAGWLASLILTSRGLGLIGNIVIGILGAAFGGWIFRTFDISVGSDWVGLLITATTGSVLLLLGLSFVRKKR